MPAMSSGAAAVIPLPAGPVALPPEPVKKAARRSENRQRRAAFLVRVHPADAERLKAEADAAAMSVAGYLASGRLAREAAARPRIRRRRATADVAALLQACVQFSRADSLLNQIARACNILALFADEHGAARVLDELQEKSYGTRSSLWVRNSMRRLRRSTRRLAMIAKGKPRAQGGKLARYLMTGEPGEIAQLVETRGLERFGKDPAAAFDRLEQWAEDKTNCRKAFFHGHIRLAPGERLSDAQWMEAVDRYEKTLGFAGQARMVSFHIEEATGDKHLHVAWFRVDLEKERAIDPGLYKNKSKRLSRDLEAKFGLKVLSNDRKPGDHAKAADRNEHEESRRLGTDLKAIRNAILDAFQKSDNGRSFAAAIHAQGLALANGDRRNCLVVVDEAGGQHALNKKLTGMTLADIRERLADLDRAALPSVDEAQQLQAERAARRAQEQGKDGGAITHDSRKTKIMATDDDEDILTKQREQRREIEDRQAGLYNDMVAERNRADRYIQDWQGDHDNGERNKRTSQQDQWRRDAEGDIADVRVRAIIAAGESRDFVQAVRREGAMITEEHAKLQRDIAIEKDPDKKHLLELKRDIQHADYMALANERIAAMGNLNGEQYKDALRQQEIWANTGTELRQERLEHQERMAEREAKAINDEVERRAQASAINAADRQRAAFRADIGGNAQPAFDPTAHPDEPALRTVARMFGMDSEQRETPREAAQTHEAAAGIAAAPAAATPATEPQRPAEVIHAEPTPPTVAERIAEVKGARENTDARQRESTSAENVEISDAKAAKLAALAHNHGATEQSVTAARERGSEDSR
jgi:hypothetical protein